VIRLEQQGGPLRFSLEADRTLTLGRGEDCDLVVPDAAVSRRHAELTADERGLRVTDLDSANGVRVNGARVREGRAEANDLIAFGAAAFRVVARETATLADDPPPRTAVRSLVDVLPTTGRDRQGRVLRGLLELVIGFPGEPTLDRFLDGITALTFEHIDADRAVLLLLEAEGAGLRPAASRSRSGDSMPVVPRSIADRAVRDRAPVVTASAPDDDRFRSGSVVMLQVRSAICAPLLADGGRVLGVLYADTITRAEPFSDEEAAGLTAFAGLAATALASALLAAEARRDREVRRSFERFFAPEVAATIASGGAAAALAGGRREVAVLFSDIRGFTGLAEQMAPEATARLLGDYLGVMVDAVFQHGGTLDKFTGDGVMAVWGAPLAAPDAAERAVRAAGAMRRALTRLNQRRTEAGQPAFHTGTGIAFGEVFAGNVGTADRLEYTVVGDPVNVAARLCAIAVEGEILLDSEIAARLRDRSGLTEREPLGIRGRRGPVSAFVVTVDLP